MQLDQVLDRYFDKLTSSLHFTLNSTGVRVKRKQDGVLEDLPPLAAEQGAAKQVDSRARHC